MGSARRAPRRATICQRLTSCPVRADDVYYTRDLFQDMLKVNITLKSIVFAEKPLFVNTLAIWRRCEKVRALLSLRHIALCGRATPRPGTEPELIAWLCTRAPLWVVVHVCQLLRPDVITPQPREAWRGQWREVARLRLLICMQACCTAGRAQPEAGARSECVSWVCERAPHWVLVRVCALLRTTAW